MAKTQVSRVHKGVRSIYYISIVVASILNPRPFSDPFRRRLCLRPAQIFFGVANALYSIEANPSYRPSCCFSRVFFHTILTPRRTHSDTHPTADPTAKVRVHRVLAIKYRKESIPSVLECSFLPSQAKKPIPNDAADHKSALCWVLAMKHGPESIHNRRTAQRECSILQPKTPIPIHAHRRRPSQHLISLQSCSVKTNRNTHTQQVDAFLPI